MSKDNKIKKKAINGQPVEERLQYLRTLAGRNINAGLVEEIALMRREIEQLKTLIARHGNLSQKT